MKKSWRYVIKHWKISGFILLFAVLGTAFVIISHASPASISIEAVNGTLSGGASIVSDPSASSGSYVQFGNQAGYRLSWAPPQCGDSTHSCQTMNLSNTGSHQTLGLSSTSDYKINLPTTGPLVGGLTLYGGHNITIIGGEVDLSTPCTTDSGPCHGFNISRSSTDTGTIHIEGVYIKNPDPTHSKYTGDGIDINGAENTDFHFENMRIEGIDGCDSGAQPSAHADVFQPYGGAHNIYIDHLTGTSDFQGMEVKEGDNGSTINSAIFKDVNIDGFYNSHGCTTTQYLWWSTASAGGFNCTVYPTTLTNDYVNPYSSFTISHGVVWPDTNTTFGCPASIANGTASWPNIPNLSNGPGGAGVITQGQPSGGDFVPASAIGLGYISPGYQ